MFPKASESQPNGPGDQQNNHSDTNDNQAKAPQNQVLFQSLPALFWRKRFQFDGVVTKPYRFHWFAQIKQAVVAGRKSNRSGCRVPPDRATRWRNGHAPRCRSRRSVAVCRPAGLDHSGDCRASRVPGWPGVTLGLDVDTDGAEPERPLLAAASAARRFGRLGHRWHCWYRSGRSRLGRSAQGPSWLLIF